LISGSDNARGAKSDPRVPWRYLFIAACASVAAGAILVLAIWSLFAATNNGEQMGTLAFDPQTPMSEYHRLLARNVGNLSATEVWRKAVVPAVAGDMPLQLPACKPVTLEGATAVRDGVDQVSLLLRITAAGETWTRGKLSYKNDDKHVIDLLGRLVEVTVRSARADARRIRVACGQRVGTEGVDLTTAEANTPAPEEITAQSATAGSEGNRQARRNVRNNAVGNKAAPSTSKKP